MDKKLIKLAVFASLGLFLVVIILAIFYILAPFILGFLYPGYDICYPEVYGTSSNLIQSLNSLCSTIKSLLGVGIMISLLIASVVSFIAVVLVLIDIIQSPNQSNKVQWVIGLLFLGILIAIIYYFLVKRKEN